MDNLYDRPWFRDHEMDYVNPDVQKVKEIIFEKIYPSPPTH